MDSSALVELLNCKRLRRYASYVWQTRRIRIGIPVKPEKDICSIGRHKIIKNIYSIIYSVNHVRILSLLIFLKTSNLAATLVLNVLNGVIPRKGVRSYLMKIISFDQVAVKLRQWRSAAESQTLMHLAVGQYDLEFIK